MDVSVSARLGVGRVRVVALLGRNIMPMRAQRVL